jgi:hypothetical protein
MDNQNPGGYQQPYEPGKSQAITSLVLGIIGNVFWLFGWWSGYATIGSLIIGIIGILMAINSKKMGYSGSIRTAGFVLSIISVIIGSLVFVACVACVACAGLFTAAASAY